MSPSRCEQPNNARPVLAVGTETRKACGPLAQLLREARPQPTVNIIVCRGGLTIDAHAMLWHQDCPTPEEARPARVATAKELLV